MKKYRKYKSSYILAKPHKTLNDGKIIYRDWVTTGGWNQMSPGKTPYYRNGNFVFTVNNIPSYQKKHKYGEWEGTYTYEDVKNARNLTNKVKVNYNSNDLRDFAYYGSCEELVRATIENIISNFPAQIVCSYLYEITKENEEGFESTGRYTISNPFMIDLCHKSITIEDGMNPMRYLSYSYENYTINGEQITDYEINYSTDYSDAMLCPNDYQYSDIITVTIKSANITLTIYGMLIDTDIIYSIKKPDNINLDEELSPIVIKPKEEIIDYYFENLDGLEKVLLNRGTTPYYKNTFLTPILGKSGFYSYVNRNYTWPSNGYQIDIESASYVEYVNGLINIARIFDENSTDNLYNKLTHEAIKNYDWTFTRDYSEGDEEKYLEGGNKISMLLRIYGRLLDDIKRSIDCIEYSNATTYDEINNQPEALISDNLETRGINAYSIVPFFENNGVKEDCSSYKVTEDFLKTIVKNSKDKNVWYTGISTDKTDPLSMDNEFMKTLYINSKYILSSKGTKDSIEMVMALFGYGIDDDYKIFEEYGYIDLSSIPDSNKGEDYAEQLHLLNENKNMVREYEDDYYSGVPMKDIVFYKEGEDKPTVIPLPFFDKRKNYDGDIYFQLKGGWGSDKDGNAYSYKETLSYLKTVSTISDMLSLDINDLKENDIVYVNNIDDIMDYDDTITDSSNIEHTFYLKDKYSSSEFYGWENTGFTDNKEISDKVNYLLSIIPTNENNNPHVGYGNYDNGKEFMEYMKCPFKYSIDNNLFDFEDTNTAENVKYEIVSKSTDGNGKVAIEDDNKYFINSKVIRIVINSDKFNNDMFIKYYNNVIFNYLIQVIPSTSILLTYFDKF